MRHAIFATVVLLQSSLLILEVSGRSNQEPINIGFIFSLPWDVSNTLRAPLAGPLSILLTSGLACILMFSLLAAPIWYIFGFPKRRYHLHNVPHARSMQMQEDLFGRGINFFDIEQGNFGILQGNITLPFSADQEDDTDSNSMIKYPDFMESMFLLIPEIDIGCKKLMICHAHGFLHIIPTKFLELYRLFSKKLLHIPDDFKEAIKGGIADQGSCMKDYGSQCPQDLLSILKLTLFELIPAEIRELWDIRM